ncbi:Hypothetical predicted protein [Lynx pardinus]|uniref:Uncharacterized protein n=1 Tax=Lynx pardinus TaxID=191816 RepID=A0A485MI02_LYNPA|nr:Hypothetical predicted protein [Lynx pardinus]
MSCQAWALQSTRISSRRRSSHLLPSEGKSEAYLFVYCFERPISRQALPIVHQSSLVLYLHSELAARQTAGRRQPKDPAARDLHPS